MREGEGRSNLRRNEAKTQMEAENKTKNDRAADRNTVTHLKYKYNSILKKRSHLCSASKVHSERVAKIDRLNLGTRKIY